MKNIISPITDPLGTNWEQPPTHEIEIDDTHALMSRKTFEGLLDYRASLPSGVYEGKMWAGRKDFGSLLYWYGSSEIPEMCSINVREILVVEER